MSLGDFTLYFQCSNRRKEGRYSSSLLGFYFCLGREGSWFQPDDDGKVLVHEKQHFRINEAEGGPCRQSNICAKYPLHSSQTSALAKDHPLLNWLPASSSHFLSPGKLFDTLKLVLVCEREVKIELVLQNTWKQLLQKLISKTQLFLLSPAVVVNWSPPEQPLT